MNGTIDLERRRVHHSQQRLVAFGQRVRRVDELLGRLPDGLPDDRP
jgi:hypothetical protein